MKYQDEQMCPESFEQNRQHNRQIQRNEELVQIECQCTKSHNGDTEKSFS